MWGFYHKYMTTLGADFAFVDVLKRWALSLDPKTIDWVFGGGLIEKSDLALVTTDTSGEKPKMSAKSIIKKVFLLLGHFVHFASFFSSYSAGIFFAMLFAFKLLVKQPIALHTSPKCPKSKKHSEENSCRIRREETCKVDEKIQQTH